MSDQPTVPAAAPAATALGPADAAAAELSQPSAAPAPFGPPLAAARQALGLSQSDVAHRLRLHPRQIAAIEAEQLSALPAATFLRGFIRNFAKEVGLAPAPLLAALDARIGSPAGPLAVDRAAGAIVRIADGGRLSRQFAVFGAVGLLLALGAIGWIASQRGGAPVSAPAPGSAAPVIAPVAASAHGADATVAGAARVVDSAAAPVAAQTNDTAVVPAAAAPAVAPLLRIAIGAQPSWIEVLQGEESRAIYSALTEAGSERELRAVPPLRLTVGNASFVQVQYRGQPVDLAPHTRGAVARLTLE